MRRRCLFTRRLRIEELPPSFGGRVAAFHRENREFHRRWEPHRLETYYTGVQQQRILRHGLRSPDIVHFWLRLKEPIGELTAGAIVGSATISGIMRGFFQSCYLGYKIDRRAARRGLMREALESVISYAFETEYLHRIEANVMPENTASRRLLEALGFRNEGMAMRYLKIDSRWEDHIHMVMLEEEWRSRAESRSRSDSVT